MYTPLLQFGARTKVTQWYEHYGYTSPKLPRNSTKGLTTYSHVLKSIFRKTKTIVATSSSWTNRCWEVEMKCFFHVISTSLFYGSYQKGRNWWWAQKTWRKLSGLTRNFLAPLLWDHKTEARISKYQAVPQPWVPCVAKPHNRWSNKATELNAASIGWHLFLLCLKFNKGQVELSGCLLFLRSMTEMAS